MSEERARRRPRRGRPESAERRRGGSPTASRLTAIRVLERVERVGAYADIALHHALSHGALTAPDRALATELVYGTLRWRGRLDYVLAERLDQPLDRLEFAVRSCLRLGAYQLLFSDRIPDSAAVDESVRCARALGVDRASGLVNAVLRRLAREREGLGFPDADREPVEHLVHALSLPRWIAERLHEQLGAEALDFAAACNRPPPLTVRARHGRVERDALLAELRDRFPDAEACRWAPAGIRLGHPGDPGRDPAFLDGRFTVQDEASQLVVELLDPQPGERVLDTCAAPGTKTTAIAERVGAEGRVLALDRHARRLQLVGRSARRLGLDNVRTLECDAREPLEELLRAPEFAGEGFDRVLVDAPCSGLGALRRNPDARWRIQPEAPAELAREQLAILERAATVLRPGGSLVYSTCTVLPEENDGVVRRFLERHRDFRVLPRAEWPAALRPGDELAEADGRLRCWPHRHGTDGFFAVRLERAAAAGSDGSGGGEAASAEAPATAPRGGPAASEPGATEDGDR